MSWHAVPTRDLIAVTINPKRLSEKNLDKFNNLHFSDIEFCKPEVRGVSNQPSPVLSKLELG